MIRSRARFSRLAELLPKSSATLPQRFFTPAALSVEIFPVTRDDQSQIEVSPERDVSEEYPQLYVEGIRLFNEEEFFDCHDVLEELWTEVTGEEKKYLQGLIQASVALFHFGNENLGGARKLYGASREKLEPYGEIYMGVNLSKFLADMKHCFEELLNAGNQYPTDVVLRDERVPRIEFPYEAPVQEQP